MSTDFTQDAVLHFLQSSGCSVKNSDLLLHFKNFIRDNADRDRNRELFKKFVNSLATVQQIDGVSYVVLRKKFRGHVPGGGERGSSGPPRLPAGKNTESSPQSVKPTPAGSTEKPRQKPQLREVTTPALPQVTAGNTVLPAAGITLNNNNNNMERNFNLKQQQVISRPELSVRPAAAPQVVSQISDKTGVKTPGLAKPPARDQCTEVRQHRVGLGPPHGITPVVAAVSHRGETSQQVPVPETLRGRETRLQPEGGLYQEPHLHHISVHPPVTSRHIRHRQSYKTAVSYDEDEEEEEEVPMRRGSAGGEWPLSAPLRDMGRAISASPPCIRDPSAPPSVDSPSSSERKLTHLHHVSVHPPVAPRHIRHRQSYKTAVSYDEDEEEEEEVPMRRGSAGGEWPLSTPLRDMGRAISASSPCIIDPSAPPSVDSPSSSERKLPQIYVQDIERETLRPGGPGWSLESGAELRGQWAGPGLEPWSVPGKSTSTGRSLPLETGRYVPSPDQAEEVAPNRDVPTDHRYSQPAGVHLEPRLGPDQSQSDWLLSSHSSILSPSSDAGLSSSSRPPSGSHRGLASNSSYEDLQARTGKTRGGTEIQEALQRAQRHHKTGYLHDDQEPTARLSPFHHSPNHLHNNQGSTASVLPWHLSTGDLDDREEAESSEGSTSSPPLRQRPPVARRLSSQLRGRMCRSLGADLDQLLQEEARGGGGNEVARLNRLHLISSSLSLHCTLSSSSLSSCSTPPRFHSIGDLVEGVEGRGGRRSLPNTSSSTAHHEGPSRQSLVPLEPREHAWLVKGAAGAWPDIYALFREDSSLLNRRDFISGFTVLHWIAKHGDHRVLNTLWYGVQKAGLTLDTNSRSTCGHTPLHIAAIHGNRNMMHLLVNKFNADVRLRDTAGKKAWQYLSRTTPPDIFQLLGAPSRAAGGGQGGVGRVDTSWKQEKQQQHRRRRRHHLSSASSGERPLTISGTAKVKRSSSIAAFLKHKSMRRFHGHQSDSSV